MKQKVSQYVVVQFGNVMTGEYLNIGVFSFDAASDANGECDEHVYHKFTNNLQRIDSVFGKDIILRYVIEDMSKLSTKKELLAYIEASSSPYTSLQFTEPRGSLSDAKDLAEDVAKTFLT